MLARCMATAALASLLLPAAPADARPKAKARAPKTAAAPGPKAVPFDPRWLVPYFTRGPAAAAAERFRLEDWKGAAAAFEKLTHKLPASSPERLPALTLLAFARMNLGLWTDGGALFEELYDKDPVLAPYHAHYAARCRLRRGDVPGALGWAARVPAGSVLEAETVLIQLDAWAATQRWAEVESAAARFLEKFPAGPRRAEAAFHRGDALEHLGRAADAAAVYRRIWAEAPLESWSRKAEERLLGSAGGADGGAWTGANAEEWLARGLVLFDHNQSAEAEAAFTEALGAKSVRDVGPPAALVCKAQFHRAQSIFKQRQRPRAVAAFAEAEKACRAAGDRDLLVKALYQGARCKASAGDRAGALQDYAALEAQAPEHSFADDARMRVAELQADANQPALAAAALAEIPRRYPQGDQLGEALWRLAFAAIRAHDWPEAHKWLDENLRLLPHEDGFAVEGRALYWKARVLFAEHKRKEALGFHTRAVREYPLSIYAFLSLERLRTEFPDARRALVRELRKGHAPTDWKFTARPIFGAPEFQRAVRLARLGLGHEARRELARLGFAPPDAAHKGAVSPDVADISWVTAVLLDRGRSWGIAHSIPRYTLTEFRRSYPERGTLPAWPVCFPRAFPELVRPAARAAQLPEALQLSIMREESAFNPRIESAANALGLTQLSLRTAQAYADGPITRESLLDPAQNLTIGSRYLGYLVGHYNGAIPLAIASYNAGETAVDKWLRERGTLELDEFIEAMPFDETRGYTKRVLSSYLTYSWLYDQEHPIPELTFSPLKPAQPVHVGRPAPAKEKRRPRR